MDVMNLDYYILGEVTVCILSAILCYNIFATFSPYERSHRLFLYSAVSSFIVSFSDVLTVFCITYYYKFPSSVSYIINFIYFVFLIAVPYFLSCYSYTLTVSKRNATKIGYIIPSVVYLLYILILIINTKTGWIFTINSTEGYIRGPYIAITYIVAVMYIVLSFVYALFTRKYVAKRLLIVFLIYPVIALLIIIVQFIYPKVLLTGVASFSSLLIAYISVQSDMLEFDLGTGLFTEHKLQKHLTLKNNKGVLYVFAIDNLSFIQGHLSSIQFHNLLLKIGNKFKSDFGVYVYHITTDRFAAIVDDINIVKNQSLQVDDYIKELGAEFKFTLPVPLSYYQVSLEFFEGEKNYNHIVEIVNNLLVKAKVSGTRSLVSCDDSVLEDMEYKRFIFDVLKRELNLESDQFQVYYQPIFSIKENKFVYMEALSRLLNTERGNISPVDFVAVAENKGLIDKLGDVAFEKICKFISENKDVVNAVSVNFSVYQISSPNIVDKVLNTIEKFGLSPSNIIIEITESVFIENFELINSNIEKLANAGIKFYLDDFGTGYSNLTTVIALPFSTVKMDRSLVLTMEESNRNYKLVKNLISTFKDANLEVLVEGVETQEQNYLVKNAGADYVQGYLYSKPLSAADCIKLLK